MRKLQTVFFIVVLLATIGCLFSVFLPGPQTPLKTVLVEIALFALLPAVFVIAFAPMTVKAIREAALRHGGELMHGVIVSAAPTGLMTNYVPEYRATIRLDDGRTSSATMLGYAGPSAGTDVMVKVNPRDPRMAVIISTG